MVRYVIEDAVISPLQVYNRLRIITREFLLSQVSGTMRAPRKMKPQAETARPKPAVCRRLFADDDDDDGPVEEGLRDNMFNQITEQINRNLDDACKKYNFDFRSEMPLEGDWSWERLTPDTAPHATSAPPVPGPDTAPAPPGDPYAPPAAPHGPSAAPFSSSVIRD